jgi:hypothetical protein
VDEVAKVVFSSKLDGKKTKEYAMLSAWAYTGAEIPTTFPTCNKIGYLNLTLALWIDPWTWNTTFFNKVINESVGKRYHVLSFSLARFKQEQITQFMEI